MPAPTTNRTRRRHESASPPRPDPGATVALRLRVGRGVDVLERRRPDLSAGLRLRLVRLLRDHEAGRVGPERYGRDLRALAQALRLAGVVPS